MLGDMSIVLALKKLVMPVSRERKLDHFYSQYREGMTVLDVGVSSEARQGLPARNHFLKRFRYPGRFYTGLGIQDLSGMTDLFPGKPFVKYSGGTFPFKSQGFDWAFSNAVIEHVGDENAQLKFLNEMLRVAAHVFFTTPNKYFPIESHSNVPFLHWNDRLFYQWCSRNKPWYNVDTLNLLSYSNLKRLLGNSRADDYAIYRNRLYGLTMTFSVICQRSQKRR
jgi:SAM-dependent methyltransferase